MIPHGRASGKREKRGGGGAGKTDVHGFCRETENRPLPHILISTDESALAGIAALVPVGSAPAPSHKTPEPQLSCPVCGTYLRGRNAPGNNLPIRHVPTPRRYAPDRPLDHRAWQLPRHD